MRRLRVFLYETCKDQSRTYEDKILADLQAYDDAVRSHGFKLITGSLTTLIESQSIIAASGAALVGTLIDGPLIGLTSGVALEVGKLGIEISKTLYSMRELKRDHRLAYIIRSRDELGHKAGSMKKR